MTLLHRERERPNEESKAVVHPSVQGHWDSLSQHASVLMMQRQLMNMLSQMLVVNKAGGGVVKCHQTNEASFGNKSKNLYGGKKKKGHHQINQGRTSCSVFILFLLLHHHALFYLFYVCKGQPWKGILVKTLPQVMAAVILPLITRDPIKSLRSSRHSDTRFSFTSVPTTLPHTHILPTEPMWCAHQQILNPCYKAPAAGR